MTDRKRKDEIERELIADAAKPEAWERIGTVEPSTSPRPRWYGKPRALDPDRTAGSPPRKELHDAIAALPEGQRHAIQLWLDGFHYSDIAHALRISVDAVKSRLRDAKRHLRPRIGDDRGASRNDPRTGGALGR